MDIPTNRLKMQHMNESGFGALSGKEEKTHEACAELLVNFPLEKHKARTLMVFEMVSSLHLHPALSSK